MYGLMLLLPAYLLITGCGGSYVSWDTNNYYEEQPPPPPPCQNVEFDQVMTDPRDGQTYGVVYINNAYWMAENLNYEMPGSCWYDDNITNGEIYGRLYTWEAAVNACPNGWHLPTDEEWRKMIKSIDGDFISQSREAFDELVTCRSDGFNAQLGGYQSFNSNDDALEFMGYYWSSSESNDEEAWYYYFTWTRWGDGWLLYDDYSKDFSLSCRCVRD